MAYSAPSSQTTSDLITAAIWNQNVVDNVTALYALAIHPAASYTRTAGNYTTSSTSMADIDATNMALTITTTGGDIDVSLAAHVSHSAANGVIALDLLLDGASKGPGSSSLLFQAYGNGANGNASFCWRITGVAAGEHTVKIQWKTNAGTVTMYASANDALRFSIMEVPAV